MMRQKIHEADNTLQSSLERLIDGLQVLCPLISNEHMNDHAIPHFFKTYGAVCAELSEDLVKYIMTIGKACCSVYGSSTHV